MLLSDSVYAAPMTKTDKKQPKEYNPFKPSDEAQNPFKSSKFTGYGGEVAPSQTKI